MGQCPSVPCSVLREALGVRREDERGGTHFPQRRRCRLVPEHALGMQQPQPGHPGMPAIPSSPAQHPVTWLSLPVRGTGAPVLSLGTPR